MNHFSNLLADFKDSGLLDPEPPRWVVRIGSTFKASDVDPRVATTSLHTALLPGDALNDAFIDLDDDEFFVEATVKQSEVWSQWKARRDGR